MIHDSKHFKSLKIALKELEPFIRSAKHLETPPFKAWRVRNQTLSPIRKRKHNFASCKFISLSKY